MADVAMRKRAPSRERLRADANRLILAGGVPAGDSADGSADDAVGGVAGSWLVSDMASSWSLW
jgi:hypothetical protein